MRRQTYIVLFVLFLLIIGSGLYLLVKGNLSRNSSNTTYEELAEEVNNDTEEDEESPHSNLGIDVPVKDLDWDALHEENNDIYAWITVTGTTIDYPVLQHPTDNTYYLNHNIDGSSGYPGCIYTEDYNSKDFSDLNTVLYGHNLKDKTMFSSLHNFEDPEVFSEDQYIFVYTEDETFVYRIFGAYEFNSNHLLLNYDYDNEYVYEQYIKDIFGVADKGYGMANIKEDIQVTKEDKIITLSTCTADHNSDQRFLVVGVLISPNGNK